MTITTHNLPGFGPPAQGSHVTVARGAALVHVAGQVGADEAGTMADGLTGQTERALRNVELALGAAGATIDDLVKMTIYVVGWEPSMIGDFLAGAGASRPGQPPADIAYTLIGVHSLFSPDVLVEIEAVAVLAE